MGNVVLSRKKQVGTKRKHLKIVSQNLEEILRRRGEGTGSCLFVSANSGPVFLLCQAASLLEGSLPRTPSSSSGSPMPPLADPAHELLRAAPVIQLVLFIIQDIAILFNVIIILLMFFNTFVFQVGLVTLLLQRFKGLLIVSAFYLGLSIAFHVWVMNLRWQHSDRYVWTDGLQALFVFQRLMAVLYYYFYKHTAECLGDTRLYEDSAWLRHQFSRGRM
ncbi:transmembrane protein 138 [Huso huso]|uniref:Transmembrane protein 138 n=1 Tax=Huso huso TaxID=61971 RepID=A0ABR0YKH7_HUSHU